MTIDQIKSAVDGGRAVCLANPGYRVRKDALGQYHIVFCANESAIGLTNRAGTRLNGRKEDFFILEGAG